MFEYKVVVAGIEYLGNEIFSCSVENAVMVNSLEIGNVISGRLDVTIQLKEVQPPIPRMANIDLYYRKDQGPWQPKGKYYIAKRVLASNDTRLELECYDKLRSLDAPFRVEGQQPEWPMSMVEAINFILVGADLALDPRTSLNPTYMLEYTNERTIREVLGDIASANGGNFTLTDEGYLYLVPAYTSITSSLDIGSDLQNYEEKNSVFKVSRVTMLWDDGEDTFFTAGNDTAQELLVSNVNATQQMTNDLLQKFNGFVYVPFIATKVYIDPKISLGDSFTVVQRTRTVHSYVMYCSGEIAFDIVSPGDDEISDEFEFQGSMKRAFSRVFKEGSWYFGVTISRLHGLQIQRTDNASAMTMNSDTWEVKIGDERVLYIDYQATPPRLVFNGSLGVNVDVGDIEVDLSGIEAQISSLSVSLAGIQTTVETQSGQISTLTQRADGFELSVGNMELDIEKAQQDAASAIGGVATLSLTVQGLNVTVANQAGEISTLTQRANSIDLTVGNMTTDVATAKQDAATAVAGVSSLTITVSGISTTVQTFDGRITTAQQTADKIEWLVASGTSSTNFTLTDRTINLVAANINLTGYVTFASLTATSGTRAYIAAENLTQGYLPASRIAAGTITNTMVTSIDGGKITTGYIDADRIQAGSITSNKLTVANGFITNAMIANLAVTGAKIALATIETANIANAAITNAKIDTLDINKIMFGNYQLLEATGTAATPTMQLGRRATQGFPSTTNINGGSINIGMPTGSYAATSINIACSGTLTLQGGTTSYLYGQTVQIGYSASIPTIYLGRVGTTTSCVRISGVELTPGASSSTGYGSLGTSSYVWNAGYINNLNAISGVKIGTTTSATVGFFGASPRSKQTVANLTQSISTTPTQAQVQAIQTKVNDLLTALRNYGLTG